jgi:hypothetical protein
VTFLEEMILVIVSFEHLCFVVLGVTGTEGQETERFLGARKPARLLVGREDSIVSLWASGKECLEAPRTTVQPVSFDKLRRRYFSVIFCY